jgi:S1-C subfamily serine protease
MIFITLSPHAHIALMMKRVALYSRRLPSSPNRTEADAAQPKQPPTKLKTERLYTLMTGIVIGAALFLAFSLLSGAPTTLSQAQIDAAVLHTLTTKDIPSRASRAAAIVAPAVVRIRNDALSSVGGAQITEHKLGIGTGVVIKEDGTILTNLHVVANAPRLVVTFSNGLESPAVVVSTQKDKDLATIKPLVVPDDLKPATLGSLLGSQVGDEVVAIGFPFGYGPSISAGVISGFNREYQSEEGPLLKGLIQFDAAVNPGNSGGPLINMAGEILGIVTAIMNPNVHKTFVGIGFAVTIDNAGTGLGVPPF